MRYWDIKWLFFSWVLIFVAKMWPWCWIDKALSWMRSILCYKNIFFQLRHANKFDSSFSPMSKSINISNTFLLKTNVAIKTKKSFFVKFYGNFVFCNRFVAFCDYSIIKTATRVLIKFWHSFINNLINLNSFVDLLYSRELLKMFM